MEEPLIETPIDFPVKSTMELVPSLIAISLRSPGIYDSVQIFPHETRSQEIKLLMVQSAVSSVFIIDDSHLSLICD